MSPSNLPRQSFLHANNAADLLSELSDFFEKRKETSTLPNDLIQKVKTILPHIVTVSPCYITLFPDTD